MVFTESLRNLSKTSVILSGAKNLNLRMRSFVVQLLRMTKSNKYKANNQRCDPNFLAVDLATMADSHDSEAMFVVIKQGNNPIIADPETDVADFGLV